MQFPARVLEDVSSCVFFCICIFLKKQNQKQHYMTICHPGSCGWSDARTWARSACCLTLPDDVPPPGGPAADPPRLIRMDEGGLTLLPLCAGPAPASSPCQPVNVSLSPPSHTHFQTRHSFNPPSLPDRLPQRRFKPRNGARPEPTFLHLCHFLFFYLFFSFRCFCVTWDLRAWIRNESGGCLFSPQPRPTVCTTDPNDPGKPLSDGLSPARASQSSLSRCSLLLLTANEICVTLCFCPHSAALQRVARQPANILFS